MHDIFSVERPNHRIPRFKERLREELASMVPSLLKDPKVHAAKMLTITDITLSKDLRHATVLFGLMNEPELAGQVQAGLNRAAGFLRRELMNRLDSKITPHLIFKFDQGLDCAKEISVLLNQIPS
ncbi:MAG: 30S ribosome-binding factor RbfA [Bacteriovoracia bacterium]